MSGSSSSSEHEEKEKDRLDELIGQLSTHSMETEGTKDQEKETPELESEETTRSIKEEEEEIKLGSAEPEPEPISTSPSNSISEEEEEEEEDREKGAKPSQLDCLLEEFNSSSQWKEPSSFYTLTNRSTPALTKTSISLPAPPLPTADDLGLEKLRLVDQAFSPPVLPTTKPLVFNHSKSSEQERTSSQLLPAHQIDNDQQPALRASRSSIESKSDSDHGIGQAYQPPYQSHPSSQATDQQQPHHTQYHQHQPAYHHPHPHHHHSLPLAAQGQQHYPTGHHHHHQQHHPIQRQNHLSISSLNSAYSAKSPAGSSPSPGPGTPTNPGQPIRQYYNPELHHPGLATTSNNIQQQQGYPGLNYSGGPTGYRDHNYNNNPHPSQSHARPTNLAQAGFGPSLQPNTSPGSSIHQVGLTRSGTSLSNTSSRSNMLIAPATNSIHHHPPSRAQTLMPPKTGPTISKASIDEYRNRIKNDPDPEAHFNYAKFLIEAARKLASGGAAGDDKAIKKYRDALLQESLKLIKKLATQGVGLGKPPYADAQFFLANCLGNGSLTLQVDHEKAYNLYVQASKQNHPAATYRTAVCNELGAGTRKDAQRAILFYRKASALGDTAGMYKLGMILLSGLLGQPKNPQEALLWLKRAAQQADEDNPHALHELAQLYEKPPLVTIGAPSTSTTTSTGTSSNGKHAAQQQATPPAQISYLVQRDEGYARELYTQAAQLGYPASQNRLGACYEYGALNCPIDPRRSIGWYTKAAERGDAESELALSGWYLTGSDGVLKQSDSEAYLWARRAASKGLPKAEYAVGYYAEVGIGVKQDIEEAKRWYMRAATNKNKRAMQRLTELKKMGAQKPTKRQARPTRDQAASECVIV
ncbi:hypothetical protein MJO28_012797 [Puccinia striiformis f. sp. tritici]|uniref:Uncharacterized protein n=1 Tax=Puccinia striiformis f. sp. tritici TaxID=168172 RepID=A0ACC0DZE1_9BASI|nr:hypothetical protein MJO28_012797 [Puccinia striiformis f. sp. tritici]